MLDEKVAERCVELARNGGTPIRWGKFGYQRNTCIRIGVRQEMDCLIESLKDL